MSAYVLELPSMGPMRPLYCVVAVQLSVLEAGHLLSACPARDALSFRYRRFTAPSGALA